MSMSLRIKVVDVTTRQEVFIEAAEDESVLQLKTKIEAEGMGIVSRFASICPRFSLVGAAL